MENKTVHQKLRRYNMYFGVLNVNYNFLSNPWISALWSFAFPGFGHLLLGMYIEGYLLVIWEIIVNTNAHINEAIVYSFTGRFDAAKHVLNLNWALLYIGVYVFCPWDSYRSSAETNIYHRLAEKEKEDIVPFKLTSISMNYLEKYEPRRVALWSAIMPGIGHILIHRIPVGFFVLTWWIIICYYSNLPIVILHTLIGDFRNVSSMLDPQWFLYAPSLYLYTIYDSYFYSVELNKLFKYEQAHFLISQYQNSHFKLPRKSRKIYGE